VVKWRLNILVGVPEMNKTAWAWVWFAFLLALDIAIPWYVLTSVEKMSAAFLFFLKWREVKS
jgi:hypothetical protein